MDDIDQTASRACCPGEPRLEGYFTSGDCPVVDVHPHKGMLRGLVVAGGTKPRPLVWHRSGRLSPKSASPFDLEGL